MTIATWVLCVCGIKYSHYLYFHYFSSLKFHSQATSATNSANRVMGLIKKSFSILNRKTLLILYKALVRPHLEYANVVWGPNYIGDCNMMERVQRRATKCIQDLEYDQRLVTLKLPTLTYRRHRADMIMVYNIMQGNVDLQLEIFLHLNLSSVTRGHNFKLFKPHAQKNVQSKFFSVRTITPWNKLLNEVVKSNSTDNFKIMIDN